MPAELITQEDSMHARPDDTTAPEREGATSTVVYTTLYDLIAVVSDALEPGEGRPLNWAPSADAVAGEEGLVTPIVAHLLRAGRAQFLRPVEVERLWNAQTHESRQEDAISVPA
jgi:hypothetical protein